MTLYVNSFILIENFSVWGMAHGALVFRRATLGTG